MFNLSQIKLHISGSPLLLIALILLSVGYSFFVYRTTIPPVAKGWKISLVVLRSLTLILVALLLFQPILSFINKKRNIPVVAVLIDHSASMSLTDQKMNRSAIVKKVLAHELFQNKSKDYRFEFFPFASHLNNPNDAIPDSLIFNGDGTDIASALNELKQKLAEKYFASVILISDGEDNLGDNPARIAAQYGRPIYTVAVGDPSEQKDILISNYVTNEIAYAGTQIPVDVYIKSSEFAGQKIPVKLMLNNRMLDRKIITLNNTGLEQKIRLYFTPEGEGLAKYKLSLPNLNGELTLANNIKTMYVKVLKSKLNVVLIAGGPSADYTFLKRVLGADENIAVQTFVEKREGRFYRNKRFLSADKLALVDCFILLDYPRKSSDTKIMATIQTFLVKGKPVLFVSGKQTDADKLWTFQNVLPLAQKPAHTREFSVYLKLNPQGLHHPVLKLAEDDVQNRENWKSLPPVFTNYRPFRLNKSAKALASVDLLRSTGFPKINMPLITVETKIKHKSAAIFAYGIWRWDLLMQGFENSNGAYQHFILNTLRWLTTEEDSKLVKISSNKEIYRSGEQINFSAQVYHKDYTPADNVEVTVQINGAHTTQDLSLNGLGEGRYEGSVQVLQGGDYAFVGSAQQNGRPLGQDSGKFSVEQFSLEFQNSRMNEDLLKQMSIASGGAFYLPADISGLKNKMRFPEKNTIVKKETELWNRAPLLIACIFLLSLEWFIRKRKGML